MAVDDVEEIDVPMSAVDALIAFLENITHDADTSGVNDVSLDEEEPEQEVTIEGEDKDISEFNFKDDDPMAKAVQRYPKATIVKDMKPPKRNG